MEQEESNHWSGMNSVELLMVEHAALRVHFRLAREVNSDSIYEIEEFVRNCHAKVEDEVIFPKLRESGNAKQEQVLSRLEADHKLIDTIGDQIKLRTAQGDVERLRKRILLYMSTVESHNSSEESLIFQYWKAGEQDATSKARKIIEEFGLNRYFAITGISEKLLDAVL
ncbi:MAG: hemerythrin domain-containing protein [Nitrososphaerales archaeon]